MTSTQAKFVAKRVSRLQKGGQAELYICEYNNRKIVEKCFYEFSREEKNQEKAMSDRVKSKNVITFMVRIRISLIYFELCHSLWFFFHYSYSLS